MLPLPPKIPTGRDRPWIVKVITLQSRSPLRPSRPMIFVYLFRYLPIVILRDQCVIVKPVEENGQVFSAQSTQSKNTA
ncbi:hypothetical protein RHMOL_Rhmol10G0020600 [Rhododendron molle]|uniref:Uncharacterized protein n=1 Tax=Rhododendron molle TaxID=49168 RepID=A0ACC0LYX6_RHOML|nr:hypothetical protein RHMOL_Rhmol10G0020600 [Rhododendron molle]